MRLRFSKMQGLGNDFVVVDGISQAIDLTPTQIRALADRHLGIGFDQLLIAAPAQRADAQFRYRIFNADGSEAELSGNGARCFARFVAERGLTHNTEIRAQTLGGLIVLKLEPDGQVTVDVGAPRFEPGEIPFIRQARALTYPLAVQHKSVEISALSIGNPHAVQFVDDLDNAPVASDGPLIENHPDFPNRVNAGFAQIVSRDHLRLRVYERGAGETLACGSGACAAVVAGITRGLLDERVRVSTRGGDLVIRWGGTGHSVLMTGPAQTVFTGEIDV